MIIYPASGTVMICQKDFKAFKFKKKYLILNWLNKDKNGYYWRVQSLGDNGIIFQVYQKTINKLYDNGTLKDTKM